MTQYLDEMQKIINEYSRVKAEMSRLMEQVESLNLKKKEVELSLSRIRESEAALIDKIKVETGEEPDFYQMLQQLFERNGVPG